MKTKIIAIANQKGGVGKTTTALNVGAALSKKGHKVLLIDLDPQGNLSTCLGYDFDGHLTINELMSSSVNNQPIDIQDCIRYNKNENVYFIPSTLTLSAAEFYLVNAFSRETVLRKILRNNSEFEQFDYILIDCLPSLGILFMNALSASDKLLIPVKASKLSLDGLQLVLNAYTQVKENINSSLEIVGILITMARHTQVSKSTENFLRANYTELIFDKTISNLEDAEKSTYLEKSLVSMKSRLGFQYEMVADEIERRI